MVKKLDPKKAVGSTTVVKTATKKSDMPMDAEKKDRANTPSAASKSKAAAEKAAKMLKQQKDKAKEMEKKKKEKEAHALKKKKEKEARELKKKKEKDAQALRKKKEKEALEGKRKKEKEALEEKRKKEREALEAKKKKEKEARELKKRKEKEALDAKKKKEKEALEAKKKAKEASKNQAPNALRKRVRNSSSRTTVVNINDTPQPEESRSRHNVGSMETPRQNSQVPSPGPGKADEAAGAGNTMCCSARPQMHSPSIEPGSTSGAAQSDPQTRRHARSSSEEPACTRPLNADTDALSPAAVQVTTNHVAGEGLEPEKLARTERRRSKQLSAPVDGCIAPLSPSSKEARWEKGQPKENVRTLNADDAALSHRARPESSLRDVGQKTSRVRSRSSKKPQSTPMSGSPPSTALALRNPKSTGKTTIILESGSIPAYVLKARAAAAQEEGQNTATSSAEPCLALQVADAAAVAKHKLAELAKMHVMREVQSQVKARAVSLARAQASDYEKARAEALLAKAKADSLARSVEVETNKYDKAKTEVLLAKAKAESLTRFAKVQAVVKAAQKQEVYRAKAAARTEARIQAAKAKMAQRAAARSHGTCEMGATPSDGTAAMQPHQHPLNLSRNPNPSETLGSRMAPTHRTTYSGEASSNDSVPMRHTPREFPRQPSSAPAAHKPSPLSPACRTANSGEISPIASAPVRNVPVKFLPPQPSSEPPSHSALAKASASMDKWAVSSISRNANAPDMHTPATKYQRPRTRTPPLSSPSAPATSSRAPAGLDPSSNYPSNVCERPGNVGISRERVHRFALPSSRPTHSPSRDAVRKNWMPNAPLAAKPHLAASARRSASARSRSSERSESSSAVQPARKRVPATSRRPSRGARSHCAPIGGNGAGRSKAPGMPLRNVERRQLVASATDRNMDIGIQHAYRGMVEPTKVQNVGPQPYESPQVADEEDGGLFSDEEEKPFPVAYADEDRNSSFVPHIPEDRLKWNEAVKTAKKELHIDGECDVGGRSAKSKMLYFRSLELYHAL